MNWESYFKIGYVIKTHGLKGEVTISILPDAPDFDELDSIFIDQKNNLVPYFIETFSPKGNKVFVKLEGLNTLDQAEKLKGCSLYLSKESRPKSGRGKFYFDEVPGFTVVDASLGEIGEVKEVSEQINNPQLVLIREGKEILIPVNSPFITSVNKSKRVVSVNLPEGFLEI
ncbi:MAG: ribosome maturation factor RimM [Flammeovirgaceae bacterium]|nr:ribosome maturation factor RimM [Flammeovirgaceae bacterium]